MAAVAAQLGQQELGPAACCPACASVPGQLHAGTNGEAGSQRCPHDV